MEISEYQFKNLGSKVSNSEIVELYNFQDISKTLKIDKDKVRKDRIGEQDIAKSKGFAISPIVKEYRGINAIENSERERRNEDEVKRRVLELEKEAFEKGYEEGVGKGRADVYEQTRMATEDKLTALTAMIGEVLRTQEEILTKQKKEIYQMIKNLTKWIILRELDGDGEYLGRLLEKLVVEVQTKNNLLIQVNQKDFEDMPEILKYVEERLGQFENVRVESDFDIERKGIVVDSENGIIDGSLEKQFENLDRLFETVGVDE